MTELKFEQLVPLYAAAGKARREAVEGDEKNYKVLREGFHTLADGWRNDYDQTLNSIKHFNTVY